MKVRIGTSGWIYPSWRGRFYPPSAGPSHYLEYYARHFPATEINYTFYHLARAETYAKWAAQTPDDFLFSVKANRVVTHERRLANLSDTWRKSLDAARALGAKLGPILIQCPPSFESRGDRLAAFLDMTAADGVRLAFEFRHESWFTPVTYRLLRNHNAALVIADSARRPRHDIVTADFVYVRYHGRARRFASNYTDLELQREARTITTYLNDGLDVFAFFNNDAEGYAVKNAESLQRFLSA